MQHESDFILKYKNQKQSIFGTNILELQYIESLSFDKNIGFLFPTKTVLSTHTQLQIYKNSKMVKIFLRILLKNKHKSLVSQRNTSLFF